MQLAIIAIFAFSACSDIKTSGSNKEIKNLDELVKILKEKDKSGLIEERENIQPHINMSKNKIKLKEQIVQVYVYEDETAAEKELKSTMETGPDWISEPHFFRKGKIVAIYVGTSGEIIEILKCKKHLE